MKRFFGSDNHAQVHPLFLKAIEQANSGHAKAYGDDAYTEKAKQIFKHHFGKQSEVFFTFLGTGANVLALSSICQPHHSVICAQSAHVFVDECGAFERFNGSKLLAVPTPDGKLSPELIEDYISGIGFEHHSQVKAISITQPTELGTIYSIEELKNLCQFAHKNNLQVHMDGARIANAAERLNVSFKSLTQVVGIDVVSFGGTKNGMMYGEAVVFINGLQSDEIKYIRKQAMQLASKMRFISAQFIQYFENDLWKSLAKQSNQMAQMLKEGIKKHPQIQIQYPVESNGLFVKMPAHLAEKLRKNSFFYDWDEAKSIYRWMCSWDTTEEDISCFLEQINTAVNRFSLE